MSGVKPTVHFHLFGAATPSGEAFQYLAGQHVLKKSISIYSRRTTECLPDRHIADFRHPASFRPAGDPNVPAIWVSFAPIWLLAPFLEKLAVSSPECLRSLRGLIACSSSSVITKRFAANNFDRQLVARLNGAEQQLLSTCRRLDVICRILRPTLIYGQIGAYSDQNLSRLVKLMRRLPLLPLPADTGLRQPIHALQLASVTLELARQIESYMVHSDLSEINEQPEILTVGGDQQLSYAAMIRALQQAQPPRDPARRCRLLPVPNRLFFVLAAPLLLRSPKAFEAVLRIAADLAGFTPAHQLLGLPPKSFPVAPLV